jgi:HK97 gp10 family phage protein
MALDLQWEGLEDVVATLREMPQRTVERALKPAVDKAARLVARAAKTNVTRRLTGMLKASIGTRTKARRGSVTAVIGPRRSSTIMRGSGGTKFQSSTRWRKNRDTKNAGLKNVVPTRYAHLIEKGHGGPHKAPAYPFLGPAMKSTSRQAQALVAAELRTNLDKILAKSKG